MLNLHDYDLNDRITLLSLLTNPDNVQDWPQDEIGYDSLESNHTSKDIDEIVHEINESSSDVYSESNIFKSYTIPHIKTTFAHRLLFIIASDINDNLKSPFQMNKYNGTFVQGTADIVISNPDNVFFIKNGVYSTLKSKNYFKFYAYKKSDSILNRIWAYELYQIKDHSIGASNQAINALKNLWIAQADKHNFNEIKNGNKAVKRPVKKLPKMFTHLLNELMSDMNDDVTQDGTDHVLIDITYAQMIDFYREVQNGKLTSKTRDVQEWLFGQNISIKTDEKSEQILKILELRPNFNDVVKHIKQIPAYKIKPILKRMSQDKLARDTGYKLSEIYSLNYHQNQVKGKNHFVGVHGTDSISIPTILFDGLKTHNELLAAKQTNFEDVGQALGDGVYMADLRQFTKSLNYSNHFGSHYKFLIISSVNYNKPVKVDDYDEDIDGDYDFVFGDKVGISHGYDEYVARHGDQIRLKYILVFKPSKKKNA